MKYKYLFAPSESYMCLGFVKDNVRPDLMQFCEGCGNIGHNLPQKPDPSCQHWHEPCKAGGLPIRYFDMTHDEYETLSTEDKKELHQDCLDAIAKEKEADYRARIAYNREHAPKCPHCNSTNLSKITTAKRALSIFTFGLASDSIGKQFKCNNCGYKW